MPFIVLALAVLMLGLVSRGGRTGGEPLDPRSTEPLGARALVLLLERFGADVRIAGGGPPPGATAVLLVDRLGSTDVDRLQRWVDAGGTLVVADPTSSFTPPLERGDFGLFEDGDRGASGDNEVPPDCGLQALAAVTRIEVEGAAGLRVGEGAVGCFPLGGGRGRYLVARSSGAGVIVAMGGAAPFVNSRLDRADNAVLAVSLMAPQSGQTVVILEPSAPGSGRQGLSDLVSRRVKDGLWQLLVAFGLAALWRARRLGRPVPEPQPVEIAGSELVVAVGNLLHQARRRDQAAAMLRAHLRRTLGSRLGLGADSPPHVLAEAAAARSAVSAAEVASALEPAPPPDDGALVALAQGVETLRNEVTHVR